MGTWGHGDMGTVNPHESSRIFVNLHECESSRVRIFFKSSSFIIHSPLTRSHGSWSWVHSSWLMGSPSHYHGESFSLSWGRRKKMTDEPLPVVRSRRTPVRGQGVIFRPLSYEVHGSFPMKDMDRGGGRVANQVPNIAFLIAVLGLPCHLVGA